MKQQSSYYRIVRTLSYCKDTIRPIFGEKIGVYDSIGSKIFIPRNSQEWEAVGRLIVNSTFKEKNKNDLKELPPVKLAEIYFALTEACNLACPGCAVGIDKIRPEDARFLTNYQVEYYLESFFKSSAENGMFDAHIKWAGGEPLLGRAFKLVQRAQSQILKLKKLYKIKVRQTILTNGVYITENVVNFCKNNDISLSISLWGTAKYQDKLRKPRSNNESYSTVIDNLQKVHDAGVLFNVNYVLAPNNAIDFPEFIKSMWDLESDTYVGKNWKIPTAIPLGITFFRPPIAYNPKITNNLYGKMESGLRLGFSVMVDLINKGIQLPPLHKFDYLDIFHTRLTTCGSGRAYIAAGPDGVADCHQGLIEKRKNFELIKKDNLFTIVKKYHWDDTKKLSVSAMTIPDEMKWLKYHGIAGCPRLAKLENNQMGFLSSISKLYLAIADEILSLETMRQLGMQNQCDQ